MRYFIKIDNLEEKINLMDKELEKIIENIERLQSLKENLEWQGNAADQFYVNYIDYIDNLKKMYRKVLNSIIFLSSFYNKYGEEYSRLKNKYNIIMSEEEISNA